MGLKGINKLEKCAECDCKGQTGKLRKVSSSKAIKAAERVLCILSVNSESIGDSILVIC